MSANAYSSIELPCSVPGIGYTLKHRNAVKLLINHYCKSAVGKIDEYGNKFTRDDYNIMINRAKCHDMDKVLMSLSYPQLTADYFHRLFNGHHEESIIEPDEKSKYDWMEMIFDMESAKYTKPDKQGGGAYAYAIKNKTHIINYILPYFKLFGLDKENTGIIQSIKVEVNKKYYETDLEEAFIEYIHTTRIHLLDGLARIDDKGYMATFNNPVPLRHNSTQNPKGIYHQRPNNIVLGSKSFISREMIKGYLEAQLFDFDKICKLSSDQVKNINRQSLVVIKQLKQNGAQR